MPAPNRFAARATWLGAILILILASCMDRDPASVVNGRAFTQVASGPIVNSLADDGDGSCTDTKCTLRDALNFADNNATITFAVTGTIVLTRGPLTIGMALTIDGPGADNLTISGNNAGRIFTVSWANGATISGVKLMAGNNSVGGGGALWASNSDLTLEDCLLTGNTAVFGGAIYSESRLTVIRSRITGNVATAYGGGGIQSNGPLLIESSTVSDNVVSGDDMSGGGIVGLDSLTLVNSTLSGNTAWLGGGIQAAGITRIVHSTITANYGGGVMAETSSDVSVRNSIIWGNFVVGSTIPMDVEASSNAGLYNSLGYNLIGDVGANVDFSVEFNATGDQTLVADAKLDALAVNTPGTTETHALLAGSPAIDAGTCAGLGSAVITTDQRGVTRPQGATCDIGAYEKEAAGLITPTLDFDLSTLPAKTFGDADFSVAAYLTTNSTGTKSFVTGTNNVACSVTTAGLVAITSAGLCVLDGSVAADATYSAAGPVSQSFTVAKAAGSVSITNIPGSAAVGGSFVPAVNKQGDGIVSIESLTPTICSVTGTNVSFDAEGQCSLRALVAEGTNYLAATGTSQNFTIGPAPVFASACVYTINAKNGQRNVTVTWQNANPGVTLVSVTDGRTLTRAIAPTASGFWKTAVKTGVPAYELRGGTARKDTSTVLVSSTPCTASP